jgi:hypothetical protein
VNEPWEEPKEEDSLTLGPEEALQREIEKSKTLKVDRLRLRDEIEKLKTEKYVLAKKNQQLIDRLAKLKNVGASHEIKTHTSSNTLVVTIVFGFLVLLWFIARN